jgi:hypothetical protein
MTSKIILNILLFMFLDIRQEKKASEVNGNKHSPNLIFS